MLFRMMNSALQRYRVVSHFFNNVFASYVVGVRFESEWNALMKVAD
jgi:hypothetical protein